MSLIREVVEREEVGEEGMSDEEGMVDEETPLEKRRWQRRVKRARRAERREEERVAERMAERYHLPEGVRVVKEEEGGADSVVLPVHIYGRVVFALLDSGASGVYMSGELWKALGRGRKSHSLNALQSTGPVDAQGEVVKGLGTTRVPVALGGAVRSLSVLVTDRLHPGLIIGLRGMREWRISMFLGHDWTRVEADSAEPGVRNIWQRKVRSPRSGQEGVACLTKPCWIPAHGGRNVWLEVAGEEAGTLGIVTMISNQNEGVSAPTVLVRTVQWEGKCWVPVALDNELQAGPVLVKPGEAEFSRDGGTGATREPSI
jgi:hypothetical protein